MDHKHSDQLRLVNPGRRRFTRGGLAAPVVLGSLASQPVLGQVGHRCTLSGQMSGNASLHGDQTPCNTLGANSTFWEGASTWPAPIVRGSLKQNAPETKAVSGTEFDGATIGATTTYSMSAVFSPTGSSALSASSYTLAHAFKTQDGKYPATMLQVLKNLTSNPSNARLGIATVTSLLNALSRPTTYPVSVSQLIAMFNAVQGGGVYMVGGVTPWDSNQVITYMQSLYM